MNFNNILPTDERSGLVAVVTYVKHSIIFFDTLERLKEFQSKVTHEIDVLVP